MWLDLPVLFEKHLPQNALPVFSEKDWLSLGRGENTTSISSSHHEYS
jgi:hypothetical protein